MCPLVSAIFECVKPLCRMERFPLWPLHQPTSSTLPGTTSVKVCYALQSFEIISNGVPLYVKGANWVPSHAFTPLANQTVARGILQSAVDAHMNMVRVWGGGKTSCPLIPPFPLHCPLPWFSLRLLQVCLRKTGFTPCVMKWGSWCRSFLPRLGLVCT